MPEQLGASFGSLEELAGALTDRGRRLERGQQAAFCALELALLDLAGRHFDRSVGELLGPLQSESVFYSGVVSADEPEGIERTCKQLLEFGVQSVKAKVGGTLEEDLRALTTIREALGDEVSLRVDANCAWDAKSALARIEAFAPFDLAAIEQPCPADDLEASALVTRECSLSTIADESLVSLADAERIIELGAFDMFNIRVSKCGGLLLSAQLRDLAREAGLGLMLGAQVGETAFERFMGQTLVKVHDGLTWAFNGEAIASGLRIPNAHWRHVVHPIRAMVLAFETTRRALGADDFVAAWGNRLLRGDIERMLAGVEPSFTPKRV